MKQRLACLSRFKRRTIVLSTLLVVGLSPAITYAAGDVDLTITKSGPGTATVGQNITYGFTVTQLDTGNSTGTSTDVTDLIPAGFTFVSATASCGVVGSSVVCTGIPDLAQNQSHSFSITFNVTAAACNASPVQNTATVDANETDTNPSNDTSNTVTTTIPCDADLSVTKTGNATVNGGDTLSYTVTVSNGGPGDATNVVVTDAVPSGLTFNSGSSSSECSLNGSNVECTLSSLSNGSSNPFTIDFDVPDTVAMCGSTISNSASVTSDTSDTITGNNTSSTVNTTVNCSADVSVSKSGPATVQGGNTVSYTVTATNAGPQTANNVVVSDPVPSGLTFNSGSSSSECSLNGSTVECTLSTLSSGGSQPFTIVFDVPDSGSPCGGNISNTATITSDTSDPSSGNNTSQTVSTSVNCQADLSITKTGPSTVDRGTTLSYTVTLRNLTDREAKDVTVEDRFNAGSISIQDAGGGDVIGNGIDWEIPTLGANDTRIFTYRVRVGPDMRHGQIISNTVVVRSPDLDRPATDIEEVRILTELPQTGSDGFFRSFKDTTQNLRPTTRTATVQAPDSAAAIQFIVWTSIISLGIIGGSLMGKRMFL